MKSLFTPCGSELPNRKILCQGKQGHKGSCFAVIYWEQEQKAELHCSCGKIHLEMKQ